MARVIQQQKSGPPYLLILFVFLFLAATTVSVLLYLQNDKEKKAADTARAQDEALGAKQVENGQIQTLLDAAKQGKGTVVEQLQQKIERLTEYITGTGKAANAENLTADAYAEANRSLGLGRLGLAVLVQRACEKIDVLAKQLKDAGDEITKLNTKDLPEKDKLIAASNKQREDDLKDFNAKVAKLDGDLQKERADREKQVADLTKDREKEIIEKAIGWSGQIFKANPQGCHLCSGSGFKGRVGIHELMLNNEELTEGINKELETAEIKRIAMRGGMKTLHQDSMLKVKQGITTIEEALANVPPDLIL